MYLSDTISDVPVVRNPLAYRAVTVQSARLVVTASQQANLGGRQPIYTAAIDRKTILGVQINMSISMPVRVRFKGKSTQVPQPTARESIHIGFVRTDALSRDDIEPGSSFALPYY